MKKIEDERRRVHQKKLAAEITHQEVDENSNHLEDSGHSSQPQAKRKRRFKRRYLQPQSKRISKRKSHTLEPGQNNLPGGWNGIVKNISDEPVSNIEQKLLQKGKQFCPTEIDPPVVRMQKELNQYYRSLRIEQIFHDKEDGRTELEKRFDKKSDWQPPKAGVEVENFIQRLQEKFDKWTPPRFAQDNLTKEERTYLKEVRKNDRMVYMWEDKGPSFVKMSKEQYLGAGNEQFNNVACYEEQPYQCYKAKT